MTRPPLAQGPTTDIGPYRLAHRIAVGGMAEVYRALWPQAAGGDRAVVIKRLLPALADDETQLQMFEEETRLGRRIDHPNVVAVLDHGVHDEAPYLVLEYVFGVDLFRLTRWVRQSKRAISRPLAIWIGTELLAGLGAVHAARDEDGQPLHVVHRDVSPANVFLSVHGDVKLGDLGIARVAMGREGALSVRAKGKLGYLPPEQVSGREVDQRGDVFSAAVVIAELLMGRPLFGGATEIGVLLAIRDGDLSALRAIEHELPVGLTQALFAALERRPQERTGSARELHASLHALREVPPDELRKELGALVIGALDDDTPSRDSTSLARTIEHDASLYEAVTPGVVTMVDGLRDSGPLYRVERADEQLGVFTLALLVRALTTGEVRATDAVRADDGPARSIAQVPELSRHLPPSTRTPEARRRTQMAETSEIYDLAQGSMLTVLVEALMASDDGLLLCEQGAVRKEIYLEGGLPCFVTSNQPEELLGEDLVRRGVIDRAELDMALAIMPRFQGRLGETLVALGLIDSVTLFRHIARQVRERVLDVFTWSDGHAALYRGVAAPERAFPLELDPWELLEEGARRRIAARLEDAAFAGRERAALVMAGPRPEPLRLSDRMQDIVTACAGPRSLPELEGLGADPRATRASILVLLALGVVAWHA